MFESETITDYFVQRRKRVAVCQSIDKERQKKKNIKGRSMTLLKCYYTDYISDRPPGNVLPTNLSAIFPFITMDNGM